MGGEGEGVDREGRGRGGELLEFQFNTLNQFVSLMTGKQPNTSSVFGQIDPSL